MQPNPYLQFKNRYRSRFPNSTDNDIRVAFNQERELPTFSNIPPDIKRRITTKSQALFHTYMVSDKSGTQLNIHGIKKRQCRDTPTIKEFKKYLAAFINTYNSKDLLIVIYYVSGYDEKGIPILIGLRFENIPSKENKNKKQSNIFIHRISILDINISVTEIKNITIHKDRKRVFNHVLEYLVFDGDDNDSIILDSDSLQELLDLRKSCDFTTKEVDDLVIEIYERENVVEKFLLSDTSDSIHPYVKVQLLVKLRGHSVLDYMLDKSLEIYPAIEQYKLAVDLLRTYTYKPTDTPPLDTLMTP